MGEIQVLPMMAALISGVLLVAALVLSLRPRFAVAGLTAAVCVMYATMPGSPSSYVLARQTGGDGPLMAGIMTATTVAAMAAMPGSAILLG